LKFLRINKKAKHIRNASLQDFQEERIKGLKDGLNLPKIRPVLVVLVVSAVLVVMRFGLPSAFASLASIAQNSGEPSAGRRIVGAEMVGSHWNYLQWHSSQKHLG
jgi:hypothetical protein